MHKFLMLLLGDFVGLHAVATRTGVSPYFGGDSFPVHFTLRHIEANGVGYNKGYTTLEMLLTAPDSLMDTFTPFIDLRGHIFTNAKLAANAGFGFRYRNSCMWGANVYYDYRQTDHHKYNQISGGLECLGEMGDFRVNAYFPITTTTSPFYNTEFAYFAGNTLYIREKREFAFTSANAEVGLSLDFSKQLPLYLAAGPYYLHGKGKTAWGGEARLQVRFMDCLQIEALGSYDHIFKWIGQGQIGLSVPIGPKPKVRVKKGRSCIKELNLLRKAVSPVDRNEIIPIDTQSKISAAINPATLPMEFLGLEVAEQLFFGYNTFMGCAAYQKPGMIQLALITQPACLYTILSNRWLDSSFDPFWGYVQTSFYLNFIGSFSPAYLKIVDNWSDANLKAYLVQYAAGYPVLDLINRANVGFLNVQTFVPY